MQFFSEGSLEYDVTKHSADDAVIARIKDCRFTLTGGPDEFFEALRVFAP